MLQIVASLMIVIYDCNSFIIQATVIVKTVFSFRQVELLNKAITSNSIVYLGTGSGKTFIAVMMIKELKDQLIQ
jgi:ERCC4-related helicase